MSVLPDVLIPGLSVVFCGSAVGAASAKRRAYYAGPGNAFWPTLAKIRLTPYQFAPEEYMTVTEHGLGLTDLAKRIAGQDSILRKEDFDRDGLKAKMLEYRPRILAFTSKRAAREYLGYPVDYGPLREAIGETILYVLPSPSGAARRYWSEKPWEELARLKGNR